MSRDDIIRMAREAGMFKLFGDPNAPEALTGESIERFAALVAAAEREACLELAKKYGDHWTVDAIRARGQA